KWRAPVLVDLPADGEIEVITACVNDPRDVKVATNTPDFTLPARYIPKLMKAFRPAIRIDNIRDETWEKVYPRIGAMTLHTASGKTIRIQIYDSGKTVAAFRVDGVPCACGAKRTTHWPEASLVCQILSEIYAEQLTCKKSDKLPYFITMLERITEESAR